VRVVPAVAAGLNQTRDRLTVVNRTGGESEDCSAILTV
jgi:hypothetical protein